MGTKLATGRRSHLGVGLGVGLAAAALSFPSVAPAAVGSWSTTSLPGTPGAVQAVAIDPFNSAILYAGTSAGGVLKSSDGGATWGPANTNLPVADVQALSADPQTPGTIYAGTFTAGVFKSTDGGASWNPASSGLAPVVDVRALAVQPGASTTVYAATASGVFKSTNGAATWSATGPMAEPDVEALALDPATPSTVYAGTFPASPTARGLYRSVDGGGLWNAVGSPLGFERPSRVISLGLRQGTPGVLYAGGVGDVRRSSDGGLGWTILPTSSLTATGLVPDADGRAVYAATIGSGVVRISDGEAGTVPVPARALPGLPDLDVPALAGNASATRLVAGTASGRVATFSVPAADLGVAISGSRTSGFTVTVTNAGPDAAPAAFAALRGGTRGFDITPAGACTFIGACSLGDLPAGGSATLTLRPIGGPTSLVEVSAGAIVHDPNPANDHAGEPVFLPPAPVPIVGVPSVSFSTAPLPSSLRAACAHLRTPRPTGGLGCVPRVTFRYPEAASARAIVGRMPTGKRTGSFRARIHPGENVLRIPSAIARTMLPGALYRVQLIFATPGTTADSSVVATFRIPRRTSPNGR